MLTLLNNTETYVTVQKNSIKKLISGLHEVLARWKNREYISNKIYNALNCTDGFAEGLWTSKDPQAGLPTENHRFFHQHSVIFSRFVSV